ncbi:hypothetical protein M2347_002515 [Chryseobacterium sp. H1D6B]|uniref:LysM peptidoglycan-binding domain-containing protein n=1 Tax=Chryseobacterium sp. H1D6B TaxID=2940588 RepID=UPI0015CC5463|nr:LysM peptidoglycan-binding domain-containing protein [Chryseobacterium sp. H1D6B]MDH6252788.1 hypothetical protein [Chryseobacterium sp. H1D6B]
MIYIKHEIRKGDTLESIASQYESNIEDLKNFHNSYCGATGLIVTDRLPLHLGYIIIDKNSIKDKEISNVRKGSSKLDIPTRYRCEQNNLVLIDGNPNFSGQTKTQYLLSHKKNIGLSLLNALLEDYISSVQPMGMEGAFELIKQIELIRDNIVFTHADGKIEKIINLKELNNKWDIFLKETSNNIPFYNELKNKSPQVIKDFIDNGEKEFSDENVFSEVISKNLFYHIILKAYMGKGINEFSFIQQSQLFPNITMNLNVVKSLVSNDETTTTYRLVGTLDKSKLDENEIMNLYEELYQPIIKYSFTEFDYIYRITYVIENESGLLIESNASIKELVKNNYEVITKFELRRVAV